MRKKWGIVLLCLLVLAIMWLTAQRMIRLEDHSLAPAGSNEDAQALVARMLRANQPWLQPASLSATYSFRRVFKRYSLREGRTANRERLGPFSVEPGCSPPRRVGSIVWTPLHVMATNSGYTVRMLGKTRWRGKEIIAVAVAFEVPVRCKVGMGGQSNTTYSSSSYPATDVRIWIDADKAVPVLLRTSGMGGTMVRPCLSTWEFPEGFYELENGRAPRAFEWASPGLFRERQEFQVMNGVWMFNKGRATARFSHSEGADGFFGKLVSRVRNFTSQNQEFELMGFALTTAGTNSSPNHAVQRAGASHLGLETNQTSSAADSRR